MSDLHGGPLEAAKQSISRRDWIAAMSVAGAALRPTAAHASFALERSRALRADGRYAPKIYTAHEWETVRMLVDYLFPKDDRSGSATEAGVPEFMDTMLFLEAGMRTAHRGGLAWLDHECRERFGGPFVAGTDAHRREILDDIAFPARAPKGYQAGVQWFNSFRDLAATGYWTSEIGVQDIGYMGNTPVMKWTGCPAANLNRLGVST